MSASISKQPVYTFFWRLTDPNPWLSNWSFHPTAIATENGEKGIFQTAEHFLMYSKAVLMGDMEVAKKILEVDGKNPSKVKALGRKVKNWDEEKWLKNRESIMVTALREKALQHKSVMKMLLETKDSIIVEASPVDFIWGIGLAKDDPRAYDPEQWRGTNLLGKCWMIVRDEFMASSKDESKAISATVAASSSKDEKSKTETDVSAST